MRKSYIFILTLLLVTFLLAACSGTAPAVTTSTEVSVAVIEPTTSQANEQQAEQIVEPTATFLPGVYPGPPPVVPTFDYTGEAYPVPTGDPTPTQPEPTPITVPTPSQDLGIVTGTLLTSDPDQQPYLTDLYLGSTIPADKEGFPPMVSLSEATDPKAAQDKTGFFLFTNIKPGFYALIVWNPITSTVIQDEKKENYYVFEVKAGEVTDLGEIYFP